MGAKEKRAGGIKKEAPLNAKGRGLARRLAFSRKRGHAFSCESKAVTGYIPQTACQGSGTVKHKVFYLKISKTGLKRLISAKKKNTPAAYASRAFYFGVGQKTAIALWERFIAMAGPRDGSAITRD